MYDDNNRTITTNKLLLRQFELSDADCVSRLCNNFNVYRGTLSLPYPYPIESALNWIPTHKEKFDNDKAYEFAVTDKDTGVLLGAIALFNNQAHKNGEAGYWIGEEYWGRGYASEALGALIDFAFSHKNLHKVIGRHFESNPASGRVMLKAGMEYEGRQKDQFFKENRYETLVLYGIINKSDNG